MGAVVRPPWLVPTQTRFSYCSVQGLACSYARKELHVSFCLGVLEPSPYGFWRPHLEVPPSAMVASAKVSITIYRLCLA